MLSRILSSLARRNNQNLPAWLTALMMASLPILLVGADIQLVSVDDVLREESLGIALNRAELLKSLHGESCIDSAKWHSGEMFLKGSWVSIDELDGRSLSPNHAKYLKERGDKELDVVALRRLARWCDVHGMKEQAVAHWYGVLGILPHDETARVSLEFKLMNGEWLTVQEIKKAKAEIDQKIKEAKVEYPKIRSLYASISGSDSKKKTKALEELKSISDPAAILALQAAAIELGNESALPFVKAIQKFHCLDACSSLLQIALSDPSSVAGQSAIEGLKKYPLECYIPDLINSLGTPIEQRHQIFTRPDGQRVIRQVISQEFRNSQVSNVSDQRLDRWDELNISWFISKRLSINRPIGASLTQDSKNVANQRSESRESYRRIRTPSPIVTESREAELREDIRVAQNQTTRINEELTSKQEPVFDVLKACTSEDCGDSVTAWWAWWDQNNELIQTKAKRYDRTYTKSDRPVLSIPIVTCKYDVYRMSCLVKGTLIQSEEGRIPIESIRLGDLVLSQDVESGKLELKPVVKTTLRPLAKTLNFATDQGAVEATLGHWWWVAGKGWVRTKELEVGMCLHTAKGTSKILSIDATPDEVETYNLVIADNHTYFVGDERLLSYDATELRSTLQLVPGLPVEILAKK